MSTLVFLILESLSSALSSLIYSSIYLFNKYVLGLGLGVLLE